MSTFGKNYVYSTATITGVNGNVITGQKATLGSKQTITSLSFYCVPGATNNIRLGLYDATGTGGQPNNLLAETADTAVVDGWNLVPLASAVTLNPGDYWFAWQCSTTGNITKSDTGPADSDWSYAKAYGAFDATFNATPTTTTALYAMYGTYSDSVAGGGLSGPLVQNLEVNVIVDGPRNTVVEVNIEVDGANLPLQNLVDMTKLSGALPNVAAYKYCRVDRIEYDVEDSMAVYLYWEGALNNAILWRLAGRGRIPTMNFGGIQNTAVNPTGNILVSTRGWTPTTGQLSASFVLTLVKQ